MHWGSMDPVCTLESKGNAYMHEGDWTGVQGQGQEMPKEV